jgi:hypothetical protein
LEGLEVDNLDESAIDQHPVLKLNPWYLKEKGQFKMNRPLKDVASKMPLLLFPVLPTC